MVSQNWSNQTSLWCCLHNGSNSAHFQTMLVLHWIEQDIKNPMPGLGMNVNLEFLECCSQHSGYLVSVSWEAIWNVRLARTELRPQTGLRCGDTWDSKMQCGNISGNSERLSVIKEVIFNASILQLWKLHLQLMWDMLNDIQDWIHQI